MFLRREPHYHTTENFAFPVVPWPLDVRFLHLRRKRLLSAGSGEHDGAPSCKGVTGKSIYMSRLICTFVRYVCHLTTNGRLALDFVCFRACRCCLQERRLTPPTFPRFMELFSVDGGKRIDSSHTIPPSIPLVLPGQSFESKMIFEKNMCLSM